MSNNLPQVECLNGPSVQERVYGGPQRAFEYCRGKEVRTVHLRNAELLKCGAVRFFQVVGHAGGSGFSGSVSVEFIKFVVACLNQRKHFAGYF